MYLKYCKGSIESGKENEGHTGAITKAAAMRASYGSERDLERGFGLFPFAYGLLFGSTGMGISLASDFARQTDAEDEVQNGPA